MSVVEQICLHLCNRPILHALGPALLSASCALPAARRDGPGVAGFVRLQPRATPVPTLRSLPLGEQSRRRGSAYWWSGSAADAAPALSSIDCDRRVDAVVGPLGATAGCRPTGTGPSVVAVGGCRQDVGVVRAGDRRAEGDEVADDHDSRSMEN
jgi:hypothetical protein